VVAIEAGPRNLTPFFSQPPDESVVADSSSFVKFWSMLTKRRAASIHPVSDKRHSRKTRLTLRAKVGRKLPKHAGRTEALLAQ